MNQANLQEILARGQEGRHVEFKASTAWDDDEFRWKIVKSVLAFSNVRDGGAIIIGVEETDDGFEPTGITDAHLATYDEDDVQELVDTRADPYANCRLEEHTGPDGNRYLVVDVEQFDQLPVVCARNGPQGLYEGRIYTRTHRMPESAPVPSQTEMREILNIAVDSQLRRYYERQERIGRGVGQTDAERFAEERGDLDV